MNRAPLWLALLCPALLPAQSLIVSNMDASTASIIDLTSGKTVATLPTSNVPHEVASSADGKWALVTDYGRQVAGTTLTLIDVASRTVARTISFAPHQRPHGARFLPDNHTAVITAEREGVIALLDVLTGEITNTRTTGQTMGHMLALSPDARTAYVANMMPGTLSYVDLTGAADPVIIKVGSQTEAINIAPDGKTVWMGSNNTGKVYVIDTEARKVVDSIQTPGFPYRMAVTPDSRTALITNPESDELRIADVATRAVRRVVTLHAPDGSAGSPQGLIISPGGDLAWVTLGGAARVAEVEIATGKVRRYFETGAGPDGIAYAPGR